MPALSPDAFPRRILLVTAGMSPAVITETIWALATQQDRAFVPTEVHCITTSRGQAQIEQTLRAGGALDALWDDYALASAAPCPPLTLHVVTALGAALPDIQTRSHNEALADQTTALIRDFTSDPDAALHVSIAGGRKTMTFLGGYVLSLFARPQDRLSHVLVDPRFEIPGFIYPPRDPEEIEVRGGTMASTADAGVTLADIPFVRLRSFLPTHPMAGPLSYSQVVETAQKLVDPPHMEVDLAGRRLVCQGMVVDFGTAEKEFAMAAYLARRICDEESKEAGAVSYAEFCDPAEQTDYNATVLRVARDAFSREAAAAEIEKRGGPISKSAFDPCLSRICDRIEASLAHLAPRYTIAAFGRAPTRRGFDLEPEEIVFSGDG